jgi:hypothetical protein
MGEIVQTKWSPDTCGCVLNYSWIRDSDENTRVHVFHSADKICQDHEHLRRGGGLQTHHLGMVQDVNDDALFIYNTVMEENQHKNILIQHVADSTPKLARQIKNKNGTVTNTIHPDVSFSFFFTETAPERVLNVSFSETLTDQEKALIEAKYPGKIKIL